MTSLQPTRIKVDNLGLSGRIMVITQSIFCGSINLWAVFHYCAWQGGYDLLGRTKDQIRTTEQINSALTACKELKLDGLVIIGGEWITYGFPSQWIYFFGEELILESYYFAGVTSNTDAAQLAETFAEAKCPTKVLYSLYLNFYGEYVVSICTAWCFRKKASKNFSFDHGFFVG